MIGSYQEASVDDDAVTPAYLDPVLEGIAFPATPPTPPQDQPWLVPQSNLTGTTLYCRSHVNRPPVGNVIESGLTSSRVWIKAPAAPVARKFAFVKSRDYSTHVHITETNPTNINTTTFVSAEVVTVEIPANETISNPIDLKYPAPIIDGCDVTAYERLRPVEIYSDLNNDGKLDDQDAKLNKMSYTSNASEADKDKVTEFIFANDQLSNGIWDKEDTDPVKPATEKFDDDAEEIAIRPGLREGEVWLDHPAIGALSFYKTRE
jgi:hypothetical protein